MADAWQKTACILCSQNCGIEVEIDAGHIVRFRGDRARVTTKAGSAVVSVEVTDTLRPGHVTLPNGLGVDYPNEAGERTSSGVAPNELTSSEDRDWLAGTPWHKHVRAQVERAP